MPSTLICTLVIVPMYPPTFAPAPRFGAPPRFAAPPGGRKNPSGKKTCRFFPQCHNMDCPFEHPKVGLGFPTYLSFFQGSYSYGKATTIILSWRVMENGQKNKVMAIENILEKSWNFSTAYHKSHMRSSDNSISTGLL